MPQSMIKRPLMLLKAVFATCAILSSLMVIAHHWKLSPIHASSLPAGATSSIATGLTSLPIENVEVGMRAAGTNPLSHQRESLPEPSAERSRKLILRMNKDSGNHLDICLIRSCSWIEAVGAAVGEEIYLDLDELGAVGDAVVLDVLPCPVIPNGSGNIVTGVFSHEADKDAEILSVSFSDGSVINGVTPNHPFWSVARQDFVEIGKLREGEAVQTRNGHTTIKSVESRHAVSGERFYNLETHNEHVYQVTLSGILVHNKCVLKLQPFREGDVLTKGVHGDVLLDHRKVSEAKLQIVDGALSWTRWGDLATSKKSLGKADKAIKDAINDPAISRAARDQVNEAINVMQGHLTHGTKNQIDFAQRNLPKFQEQLRLLNELIGG